MRKTGKHLPHLFRGTLAAAMLMLLSTTALAGAVDGCDVNNSCPHPEQPGNAGYVSRVTVKPPGTTAPSTEYRRLDKETAATLTGARPEGKAAPATACKDAKPADNDAPFSISIDGAPSGAAAVPNDADVTRCTDVALDDSKIEVRYDGLKAAPALNVTVTPEAVVRGEVETFTPYSNYAAFIDHAEVRIFPFGGSIQKTPLAVIPVTRLDGTVNWLPPEELDGAPLVYLLRVYGKKGVFDETTPKRLDVVDKRRPTDKFDTKKAEELTGYGENHLGTQNIHIHGGMVSVNGRDVPNGQGVTVLGQNVPVDSEGKFAVRQILPPGDQTVTVQTGSEKGERRDFTRDISIPKNDWFYMGIADLTVGKNSVSGPAALVTDDDSRRNRGDVYADGRLAYYFKGKVADDWLLTSSADTQEYELGDLFSNFGSKDPQSILRRLDSNYYYPVYGDDSTLEEDAPTKGRFYIKAQHDDSSLMWGNFQTRITGTDLMDYRRSLYGADGQYNSHETTTYGERRTEAEAFAADPGTLDSIEEFRGTGGSLYYLRNQDVVTGSERLRVEVRDQDSNIVLATKTLTYGEDYDINYIQGRVVLREALSSTSDTDTLIHEGSLSGNKVYLVATYEYAPTVTAISNFTQGGRASHWFGDHLRVGVTGYDQKGSGVGQQAGGADVILRYKPGTYIKAEGATSDGTGTGALSSQDGGFDFGPVPQTTTPNVNAHAYRVEGAVDLAEITGGRHDGHLDSYWVKREDGYSAPGELTNEGVTQAGGKLKLPITKDLSVYAKGDYKEGTLSGTDISAEFGGEYLFLPATTLALALRHDDRDTALAAGASTLLTQTGERTDAIAKLGYAPLKDDGTAGRYNIYGLVQGTLSRSDTRAENNRYGIGGGYRISDKVALNAEATDGNGGWGGKAGVDYTVTDRTSMYINYIADTDRSDQGYRGRSNSVVTGTKTRYSDSLSVYSEERYQNAEQGPSGLIHSYGLDFAANDRWTYGAKFENGTTSDPATGDLRRTAVSLSTGYSHDKVKYGGTVEFRREDGNVSGERDSWLTKNTLAYQASPDWRFLGSAELAFSDANAGATTDANYTEVSAGFGYRPALNDRFNGLFKYTYLSDLSSPGQLSAGLANPYDQRSHVLNVDGIYDVTPRISLGAKVGYRLSELKDTSLPNGEWFDSQAYLGVLRTDLHIVNEWDASAEIRYLSASEADDAKSGALIGIYRHINQNLKFGGGYNFTDFSDDITNLDYRSRGFFINLVGSM